MTDVGTFGLQVFNTIGELFHKGETRLDPDSAEAIELRKLAYAAAGVKAGDDPLLLTPSVGVTVTRSS
jgi:hypothetical protein